jgi:hypothetical protein
VIIASHSAPVDGDARQSRKRHAYWLEDLVHAGAERRQPASPSTGHDHARLAFGAEQYAATVWRRTRRTDSAHWLGRPAGGDERDSRARRAACLARRRAGPSDSTDCYQCQRERAKPCHAALTPRIASGFRAYRALTVRVGRASSMQPYGRAGAVGRGPPGQITPRGTAGTARPADTTSPPAAASSTVMGLHIDISLRLGT